MTLIIITGPTASGKTKLAARIADTLNGEIISADSRQVYRGMDIGTGKDLSDYVIDGKPIPYHLIDIRDAGDEYNLFEYQKDFAKVYDDVTSRGKTPVVVGGTGLYIEAVLKNFQQTAVPVNEGLRDRLKTKDKTELEKYLAEINRQKLNFDTTTSKRLIRAIEICQFLDQNSLKEHPAQTYKYIIFCLDPGRDVLLERIRHRLRYRLENGMVEEVERLISQGVSKEKLRYYGLEYKFITDHLEGEFTYEEMFEKLNIAIRQYAKRQMTWFRRMERNGFEIDWVKGELSQDEQIGQVLDTLEGKL